MIAVFPDDPTNEPVDDTPPTYWSRLMGYIHLLIEKYQQRQKEEGQDTPDGGAK